MYRSSGARKRTYGKPFFVETMTLRRAPSIDRCSRDLGSAQTAVDASGHAITIKMEIKTGAGKSDLAFDAVIKGDKDINTLTLPDLSHSASLESHAVNCSSRHFLEYLAGPSALQNSL